MYRIVALALRLIERRNGLGLAAVGALQLDHLMSRTSNAGDELGLDRVDAAALARLLHRLDEVLLLLVGESIFALDFAAAAALDAVWVVRGIDGSSNGS